MKQINKSRQRNIFKYLIYVHAYDANTGSIHVLGISQKNILMTNHNFRYKKKNIA